MIRAIARASFLAVPLLLAACSDGGGSDDAPAIADDDPVGGPIAGEAPDPDGDPVGGGPGATPGEGGGVNFALRIGPDVAATTTDRWQSYFTRQMEAALEPLNALPGLVERTIPVTYARCGQSNAFYDPMRREITICDEIVDDQLVYWSNTPSAILSTVFILYHEIGHALDDVRNVPISGNIESAADSIAVVLATETGRGVAAVFGGDFLSRAPASYADEHNSGPDRAGDIICWAIGGTSRLTFNSALAPLTSQFIEANRDCVEEYMGQRDAIFTSVPDLVSIVPSALIDPDDIAPDDPDPPKNVSGADPGEFGGSALDALQNETDATIGQDVWLCSASERPFDVVYTFVGTRGFYAQLTGADTIRVESFDVVAADATSVRLDYPGIGLTETIANIRFAGVSAFGALSDVEGMLSCRRAALPPPTEEPGPVPVSVEDDPFVPLYGTVVLRWSFAGRPGELETALRFTPEGRRTLGSGAALVDAEEAGAFGAVTCTADDAARAFLCTGFLDDGAVTLFLFAVDDAGEGAGRVASCAPTLAAEACLARLDGDGDGPLTVAVSRESPPAGSFAGRLASLGAAAR